MVGAKVGGELREKGLTALALSVVAMLIYLSFRFEWKFALASVIGLVHDIIVTMGAISLFQVEVNLDILAFHRVRTTALKGDMLELTSNAS